MLPKSSYTLMLTKPPSNLRSPIFWATCICTSLWLQILYCSKLQPCFQSWQHTVLLFLVTKQETVGMWAWSDVLQLELLVAKEEHLATLGTDNRNGFTSLGGHSSGRDLISVLVSCWVSAPPFSWLSGVSCDVTVYKRNSATQTDQSTNETPSNNKYDCTAS